MLNDKENEKKAFFVCPVSPVGTFEHLCQLTGSMKVVTSDCKDIICVAEMVGVNTARDKALLKQF